MKFSLFSVLSLAASTSAFTVVRQSAVRPGSKLNSTPEDEIAALRAAAAKAREEASKLSAVRFFDNGAFHSDLIGTKAFSQQSFFRHTTGTRQRRGSDSHSSQEIV